MPRRITLSARLRDWDGLRNAVVGVEHDLLLIPFGVGLGHLKPAVGLVRHGGYSQLLLSRPANAEGLVKGASRPTLCLMNLARTSSPAVQMETAISSHIQLEGVLLPRCTPPSPSARVMTCSRLSTSSLAASLSWTTRFMTGSSWSSLSGSLRARRTLCRTAFGLLWRRKR